MQLLDDVVVSSLVRVEVPSALWRKQRDGHLSAEDAALLHALFEVEVTGDDEVGPQYAAIAVTGSVLEEAGRLVAVHALRSLDALQLSSALAARRADEACTTFACVDHGLRAAAASLGFALLPALLPPPSRDG